MFLTPATVTETSTAPKTVDTRHVDQALTTLGARKTEWARLPVQDKTGYLKQTQRLALTHASLGVCMSDSSVYRNGRPCR